MCAKAYHILADDHNTFFTEQICYSHTDLYNALNTSRSLQDEKWIVKPTGCPLYTIPVQTPSASLLSSPASSPSKTKRSLYSEEEAYRRTITGKILFFHRILRLLTSYRLVVGFFYFRCSGDRGISSIPLFTPLLLHETYRRNASNFS